jgi:hypothetical protein
MRHLLLICLAFFLAGGALAASKSKLSDARIEPSQFSEYRAAVEAELRSGELYREMSVDHRNEVRAILQRMDDTLVGVDTVDTLAPAAKVALFNDQERLRVLLGQAEEDSRMICRREKVVGSNMPKNVCLTVAERRRAREEGQAFLRYQGSSRALPIPDSN